MPKLALIYSTASFAASAVPRVSIASGAKVESNIYHTGRLKNDSPFGGSAWVKSDAKNKRKKE